MTIRCANLANLIDVCARLAEKGLTFEASTETMIITLTGGY